MEQSNRTVLIASGAVGNQEVQRRQEQFLLRNRYWKHVLRRRVGDCIADLARSFDVKYITLYKAVDGTNWKHL